MAKGDDRIDSQRAARGNETGEERDEDEEERERNESLGISW